MKRILLLGSTGQIGGELMRYLATLGSVSAPRRDAADFLNPSVLRDLVMRERPDVIVNAAAYTDVDSAERDPDAAFTVNAVAPGVLGAAAAECDAILLHYSTDYVFNGVSNHPYREDDPTCPLNAYGKSKLAGERALLDSHCRVIILRTSWVYGLYGKNFLLTVQRLVDQGSPLRIVDDQIGAPTWSRCVAECSLAVLKCALSHEFSDWDVYHMTCAGQSTWCEFARAIVQRRAPVEGICTDDLPRPAPHGLFMSHGLSQW